MGEKWRGGKGREGGGKRKDGKGGRNGEVSREVGVPYRHFFFPTSNHVQVDRSVRCLCDWTIPTE